MQVRELDRAICAVTSQWAGEGPWPACIPLSYSTHELAIRPEAYDPKLDAGLGPLREEDLTAASVGEAA